MTTTERVAVVGPREAQWIRLRLEAHRLCSVGYGRDAIAAQLKVHRRTVNRYLSLPCPEGDFAYPTEPDDLEQLQREGSCYDHPEIDWFSTERVEQASAKAVCAQCPVMVTCRRYGLSDARPEFGIWGGLTQEARGQEVARRRKAEREHRARVNERRRHREDDGGGSRRGVA